MPRLGLNILANFAGRASTVLLAVLFTPLYIRFLGIEAYALIGFYLTLQASLGFLEMGLSRACTREVARLTGADQGASQEVADTVRTLEIVYWSVGILLGIMLTLAAPWIATHWLNASQLSPVQTVTAITGMAWVIALRWPMSLYAGVLTGLQRHIHLNIAFAATSIINAGGAVLVLWLVRADITAYFQWQVFAAGCAALAFALLARRMLPCRMQAGRYSSSRLRAVLGLSAGIGLNAMLGMCLRQADKLLLSALLSLEQFGYYAFASLVVSVVPIIADAVTNALFPRLSHAVGSGMPPARIGALYHFGSQIVAVAIIPLCVMLSLFPWEFVYAYTGDRSLATQVAPVLSVLIVAKMLHASMLAPYALQLAYGWVSLGMYVNVVSLAVFLPILYILALNFGMLGAAFAWLLVTVGYVSVGVPLLHRRLLVGQAGSWMLRALIVPSAVAAMVLLPLRWIASDSAGRIEFSVILTAGTGFATIMIIVFTKPLKRRVLNFIRTQFS